MISATYTQGGQFSVMDIAVPAIADDELLLNVRASSICGTDLRIIKNGHRKLQAGRRIALGHEFSGVIVERGARVKGFNPGTRVSVAPNIGCGQCDYCIQGLTNMCPDYTAFGITFDGAHAEYVRIPAEALAQGNVMPLPDSLGFVEAALIEPLCCVVNGIRASQIQLGDTVVVFGAGPIGLMHIMLANISGAAKVIAVDHQAHRLVTAKEAGADITINGTEEDVRDRVMEETKGLGANVVITACSAASVQEQSLGLLAPYGRVCFFGGLPADTKVPLDTNIIHYKNLIATGVTGGSLYDYRLAMKLITSKRIRTDFIISHTFGTQEMEAAFETALHGAAMKVVISQQAA